MKHIIIVKDMKQEDVPRLEDALECAGISFALDQELGSVTVHERGDMVAKAKRVLSELGFEVL